MDVRAVPPGSTISAVPITRTVNADGVVGDEEALATYEVLAAHHVPATDHVSASVFWDFMNAIGPVAPDSPFGAIVEEPLFDNPFYTVGLPLTEAYWMFVDVDEIPQWILVQAFERRVLTYAPGNDPRWQVEAGNVGQHYYMWRYGEKL